MVKTRQRIVEIEATMKELKNDSQRALDAKSSSYHISVKPSHGPGDDLGLKEDATRTNRGR